MEQIREKLPILEADYECSRETNMEAQRDADYEYFMSLTLRRGGGVCDECKGMNYRAFHLTDCPKCKGTGKLPVEEKSLLEWVKLGMEAIK